jgi:peroxiredoxin Q/BCP
MSMPVAGDPAPDFSLVDDHGVMRRLSDQRGHWTVVYFYPKDDTSGCTTQACSLRDSMADLEGEDVTVWGVSRDDTASHVRFRDKYTLPFPLLSDPDHAVHEAYGAWVEKLSYGKRIMGAQRATFLIDPAGRIARVWPKATPEGHGPDVLVAVREVRGGGTGAG